MFNIDVRVDATMLMVGSMLVDIYINCMSANFYV